MSVFVVGALLLATAAALGDAQTARDYSAATLVETNTIANFAAENPGYVAVTAEGDIAVAFTGGTEKVVIFSGADLSELATITPAASGDARLAVHADGYLVVAEQDASLSMYSTAAYPLGAAVASISITANCDFPRGAHAQKTGAKQVYLTCGTTDICRYASDLSSETCTTISDDPVYAIEVSPDDSYVVAYTRKTDGIPRLHKLDASDLSEVFNVAIDTITTTTFDSSRYEVTSVSIRSDNTVVFPDHDNNGIHVVDFSGTSAPGAGSATMVSLAGSCDGPEAVYGNQDGTGDIVVYCDGADADDSIVILPSDVSTGNMAVINTDTGGTPLSISPYDIDGVKAAAVTSDTTVLLFDNMDDIVVFKGSNAPGSTGDPVIVDIHGHRFIAGSRPFTDYLLYESASGADRIVMTTGPVQGKENGYFVAKLAIGRAGCGEMILSARSEHTLSRTAPACFDDLVLQGDTGLLGYALMSQTLAMIQPHSIRASDVGFININFAGLTPEFTTDCRGMVCSESHMEQLAF